MLAVSPSMNHPTFTGITLRLVQWAIFCPVTHRRQHCHILTRKPTQVVVNVPVIKRTTKTFKVVVSNRRERHVERRARNLDINPFPHPILATAKSTKRGSGVVSSYEQQNLWSRRIELPINNQRKICEMRTHIRSLGTVREIPSRASIIHICETTQRFLHLT